MEQKPRCFCFAAGADRSIRGGAPKSRSAAGRLRSRPAEGLFCQLRGIEERGWYLPMAY